MFSALVISAVLSSAPVKRDLIEWEQGSFVVNLATGRREFVVTAGEVEERVRLAGGATYTRRGDGPWVEWFPPARGFFRQANPQPEPAPNPTN